MTALNIKNAEAYRLAQEVAAATGDSLTGAVIAALREKRAALGLADPDRAARRETIRALGRKYGPLARRLGVTSDHADLYDPDGLPK